MKKLISFILLQLMAGTVLAQHTEFGKHNNGLIYSPGTVSQLKHIVDSLNLKFKVCELNKTYLAKAQARAHYVSVEKPNVNEAISDMEAGLGFEEFEKKYRKAEVEKDLLVVKYSYINETKDVVDFTAIRIGKGSERELSFDKDLKRFETTLKGKWIYERHKKTNWSEEYVEAFYFPEELRSPALPITYARMVQYSDCLVDTAAQVYFKEARYGGVRYNDESPRAVKQFMDYLTPPIKEPTYESDHYEEYSKAMRIWDSLKTLYVDSLAKNDAGFHSKLNDAIKEALAKGGTNDEFEDIVGKYSSRKTELALKRNRIVVGGCSMDDSPRIHAFNIALLSAETVKWEIFLRSHLDIMNDRFDRMSDGSYAWEARKTYIKELEVLDINVPDLLLGICLRVENASDNHYYGSIGRIGRALAESNNRTELEDKILGMIADEKLDDLNRVLMYYLFDNYNHNLTAKDQQEANAKRLKKTSTLLPDYISAKIK